MDAEPAVQKLCTICGKDVAGQQRAKDGQGNYYCAACWDARSTGQPSPTLDAAPPADRAETDIAPSVDPSALFSVSTDVGPFTYLASQFACNGVVWVGSVVASPVAIYLVKKRRFQRSGGGGLVGALISEALKKDDDGMRTCTVAELPQAVQQQADPKGKFFAKTVVAIPRSTVSMVKVAKVNNVVVVNSGSDTFKIHPNMFTHFKTSGKLLALGWTLNQPLVPEHAPVHNIPAADGTPPPQSSLLYRVGMIILAIILVIVVVAIRVALHH